MLVKANEQKMAERHIHLGEPPHHCRSSSPILGFLHWHCSQGLHVAQHHAASPNMCQTLTLHLLQSANLFVSVMQNAGFETHLQQIQ